jgi:hypothetical protein
MSNGMCRTAKRIYLKKMDSKFEYSCAVSLWRGETVSLWNCGRYRTHWPSLKWYMSKYGTSVEWHLQRSTKGLGGKSVPVPLCPPQIPHGLPLQRAGASGVRSRRLTPSAMARPTVCSCWEDKEKTSSITQEATWYFYITGLNKACRMNCVQGITTVI